jgi:hypothetical protein
MTSIEWFYDEIKHIIPNDFLPKYEEAKKMHKQEIMNTYIIADSESTQEDSEYYALKFYERTYGSKGSYDHIVDTNEMVMSEKPTDHKDKIVQQVIDKFNQRSELGIKKYGTTLEENNNDDYFTHLQEELMDAILYIEKLKSINQLS